MKVQRTIQIKISPRETTDKNDKTTISRPATLLVTLERWKGMERKILTRTRLKNLTTNNYKNLTTHYQSDQQQPHP
jgi:hypothetical protein